MFQPLTMEANMVEEKSRAEQEQQAASDAKYGSLPDPNAGSYYLNAYNDYKANNPPPPLETY